MSIVYPTRRLPTEKSYVAVAISTNVDGWTGTDVVDSGGHALCGLAVETGSSDANYTIWGGHTTSTGTGLDAMRPIYNSTGGNITFGSTAAGVTPGKTLVPTDPALFMGFRFIGVQSGVPGAAIAGQSGVSMGLYFAPRGPFK